MIIKNTEKNLKNKKESTKEYQIFMILIEKKE